MEEGSSEAEAVANQKADLLPAVANFAHVGPRYLNFLLLEPRTTLRCNQSSLSSRSTDPNQFA